MNRASSSQTTGWHFDTSYLGLPDLFYHRQNPVPVAKPELVILNHALAESLGLDAEQFSQNDGASIFAGNTIPEGAEPLAQAYAGHQFGHFTMLGDGRAILLGEQITPEGKRFDIQLKGGGRTAFSRGGDGRAALGPMLREYIISEAMHALGIPTTRSLAVVTTGEHVYRDTPLPGAILTRVASSHIRVGTFEYASLQRDRDALKALADYTIHRHYPELSEADNPYLAMFKGVMERQASLIAKWQAIGFVHGVMNTDNMTLCGETIDYGPCAFMDTYDPATVFSSIDRRGRYAYGNQPQIAQWNLARLVETLLPLLHENPEEALTLAEGAVAEFPAFFQQCYLAEMRPKLGLLTEEANDHHLIESLLLWMQDNYKDYTQTFRKLSPQASEEPYFTESGFEDWYAQWQARLTRQPDSTEVVLAYMQAHNPAVIPRNYRVEEALEAAVDHHDFSVMHQLLAALKTPFNSADNHYMLPPPPSDKTYRTFCGT